MFDWKKAIETNLAELGGREVCVSGARLHQLVSKVGRERGEHFGAFLKERGLSFSAFIQTELPEISVYKRGSTDMLVGFADATVPVATKGWSAARDKSFRQDVFLAFTQISPKPFAYLPDEDQFAPNPDEAADSIPTPETTLDELVERRRDFSNQLEDEDAKTRLVHALNFSVNPLAAFSSELAQSGLRREWHDFNYVVISDKIRAWATEANIDAVNDWFEPSGEEYIPRTTPQQVLSELAPYLTDEEARSLKIPFRAIEKMYHALSRQRGTDKI